RRNPAQLEERGDEVRRQLLTESRNRVKAAQSRVSQHRQSLGKTGQLIEGRAHLSCNFRCFFGCAEQLFALLKVSVAQRLDPAQRTDQMTLGRLLPDCQQ